MDQQINKYYFDYILEDWVYPEIEDEILWNGIKVLLLKINRTKMPPESGRKNLIAVDKNEKIIWIASLPQSYPFFGSFHKIAIKDQTVEALCGSTLCVISLITGEIISEKFIK